MRSTLNRWVIRSFGSFFLDPRLLSSIIVLTVSPTRNVHLGGEPLALATAPVRAAGSLSEAGLGAIRACICGDRNLDRHPLKRVAFSDKAANHRHYLPDVASGPDRDEIKSADP